MREGIQTELFWKAENVIEDYERSYGHHRKGERSTYSRLILSAVIITIRQTGEKGFEEWKTRRLA